MGNAKYPLTASMGFNRVGCSQVLWIISKCQVVCYSRAFRHLCVNTVPIGKDIISCCCISNRKELQNHVQGILRWTRVRKIIHNWKTLKTVSSLPGSGRPSKGISTAWSGCSMLRETQKTECHHSTIGGRRNKFVFGLEGLPLPV